MGIYTFLKSGGFASSRVQYILMSNSSKDPVGISFLAIAGGGGAGTPGSNRAGCGGAGGYRSSWNSELSGGGGSAESKVLITPGVSYPTGIGAGGAQLSSGSLTYFGPISTVGGGRGGDNGGNGTTGGSGGGGGSFSSAGGSGIQNQGFAGGSGFTFNGGGGAGSIPYRAIGSPATGTGLGGGDGRASTITGTSVTRALGGEPNGDASSTPANSGNGAPAGMSGSSFPGASGVLILRYPNTLTITIGAGLTGSTATSGSDRITTITAGIGNLSWAA
jgi:hypothetical protein